jgi:hypothetical protein
MGDIAATRLGFMAELAQQRWDDHRYYHHSRINQSLHLLSALSFLTGYVLLFFAPAMAALVCWLVGMLSRQSGHFFFEPKGYDHVNDASHEHKEAIKVGYNLHRKVVLMAIWAATPLLLWADPSVLGLLPPPIDAMSWLNNLGWLWIAVGVGGLLYRTIQLFFLRDVQTGLVWFTKILTDPFHDVYLYHRAPLFLMKGQLIDPDVAKR